MGVPPVLPGRPPYRSGEDPEREKGLEELNRDYAGAPWLTALVQFSGFLAVFAWTTIFNELTWPAATAWALTGPGDEEYSGEDKPHAHPSRGPGARGSLCPRFRSGRWITRFN